MGETLNMHMHQTQGFLYTGQLVLHWSLAYLFVQTRKSILA